MDVLQILACCQFAIRHVKEVGVPDQLSQQIPCLTVRRVVGYVATRRGEVHRDATIIGNRQDIEQLLQVRPMILAVSESNCQAGPLASLGFFGRIFIRAVERHARGIVVQLIQAEIELLHDMPHDVQHQLRKIGGKQPIQTATDAIVIEVLKVLSSSPEVQGQTAPPILPIRRSAHAKAECFGAAGASNVMSEWPSSGYHAASAA